MKKKTVDKKEEWFKTLREIKQFCSKREGCEGCQLYINDDLECMLTSPPDGWTLPKVCKHCGKDCS